MERIAVFPGSFDPITKGHEDLILRASSLFDKVIVAIGVNSSKKSHFSTSQRLAFIEQTFVTKPNISVDTFEGLTIDYCKTMNAHFILRGLRNTLDFDYEKSIAQLNSQLAPDIETFFLATSAEFSGINSTIVREIISNGGDVSMFLPTNVIVK